MGSTYQIIIKMISVSRVLFLHVVDKDLFPIITYITQEWAQKLDLALNTTGYGPKLSSLQKVKQLNQLYLVHECSSELRIITW